jgi:hypothetical protein
MKQSQDERYHRLEFEAITINGEQRTDLLLDFRKVFMIHTQDLYDALVPGGIQRLGVIPPVFLHDMMHRSFAYMSRVGLPD